MGSLQPISPNNPSFVRRSKMLLAPVLAALLLVSPFLASPLPDEEPGALAEEEDRFSGAIIGSILLQILVNIIRGQIQEILGISTTTKATPILDLIGGVLFPQAESTTASTGNETTTTASSTSTSTTSTTVTTTAVPTTTTTTAAPEPTTNSESASTTTTARCGGIFGGGLLGC